jgi:D-proline reductase (dithiol) PrdB
VQREVEQQGIATVGISLARRISEQVRPPRTYFLRYPFGHPLGEPFNEPQQRAIVNDALALLETVQEPGTIVDSPYRWRRHDFRAGPGRDPGGR